MTRDRSWRSRDGCLSIVRFGLFEMEAPVCEPGNACACSTSAPADTRCARSGGDEGARRLLLWRARWWRAVAGGVPGSSPTRRRGGGAAGRGRTTARPASAAGSAHLGGARLRRTPLGDPAWSLHSLTAAPTRADRSGRGVGDGVEGRIHGGARRSHGPRAGGVAQGRLLARRRARHVHWLRRSAAW